jgi:hypothetical protein
MAVDYLIDRCGVPRSDYLPTLDVVSPLAYILSHDDFDEDLHDQQLQQWYWSVCFNQHFSGAPESKTAKECRDWFGKEGWAYNLENVPDSCGELSLSVDDLSSATSASTIYKTVFTFLIANGGWDMGLGADGTRRKLSALEPHEIEDHHVFPRQFLYSSNIKGVQANGILNRVPISVGANRKIGSLAPHIYLSDETLVGSLGQAELGTLGMSEALLRSEFAGETYKSFINDRGRRVIELVANVLPNVDTGA